jgi:nucleotide-binding universal stress UspA family protein
MIASPPAPVPEIPLEAYLAADEEKEKAAREQVQQMVRSAVEEMRKLLPSPAIHISGQVVISDRVDESIVRRAQEAQADLIVMGAQGVGALRGALPGSVSHALIARAECPVLVVK